MCVCNKNIFFENIKNAVCDFLTHERERQREFFYYLSAFSPIPFSLLADISG